jgi:hypothetical protein
MMENYNKGLLKLAWNARYCDSQWPNQPECRRMWLEEYP